MKKIKTLQLGALLIGTAICFGTMRPAVAVAADANPIVFSAVARDADGFVKNNATLQLDCRLVDRETRNTVYSETHTLSADAMGQLQIPLGDGTPTYGNFQQVDFSQPLDLLVFDGDQLLTDAPLTQVPSAAFAQTADHAETANNALSAQTLDGIAFDDEAEPDQSTIWSSAKVSQMLGNQQQGVQSGQTAIAKERAERMAEDQRIWDSLNVRGNDLIAMNERFNEQDERLNGMDERMHEQEASIDALEERADGHDEAINALEERTNGMDQHLHDLDDDLSTLKERVDGHDAAINTLEERVEGMDGHMHDLDDDLSALEERVSANEGNINTLEERTEDIDRHLHDLEANVNDSLEVVWDSIDALKDELRQQQEEIERQMGDINYCLVNDAERGIYHNAIPLYDADKPDTIGLFANPILKVLRQDGHCALFSALHLASQLKRSYRARVMTYNTSGDPTSPKEVYIPASTAGLDIYVDNYRMDVPVVYYTYDALVFDVEFYYLGDDTTPKLYVTLIRE